MLSKLLLIFKGLSTDITGSLEGIAAVVIDPFVLHPAAVAGEDGAALPPAHVRLDAGVLVQVPLQVGLDEELFATNVAGEPRISGVLPFVFFQVMPFPVLFVAACADGKRL